MENNNKNIEFDKIQNLDDLIFEMINSDNEEAEKILKENGINIEEIKSKGLVYLREKQIKHEMDLNKRNRSFLMEQAKNSMRNISRQPNQQMLLQSLPVQFRNLKSFTNEDFLEMLDEIELLKFIEAIKEKQK